MLMNRTRWVACAALCVSMHAQAVDSAAPPPDPGAPERLSQARLAIQHADWKTAMSELQAALRQDARNADVHNLLGYTYRKQAQPNVNKALEHYKTALTLDPEHKGAHEYIGEAYLMRQDLASAQAHLAQLERLCSGKTCEEYQDLARAIEGYKANIR